MSDVGLKIWTVSSVEKNLFMGATTRIQVMIIARVVCEGFGSKKAIDISVFEIIVRLILNAERS